MIRFALLGAGFIGAAHAKNLAANTRVNLSYIYDVDLQRAKDLADLYGAKATDDLATIYAEGAVDAVLIASSTPTHSDHLRRSADAGIAAFCEKPIDLNLEKAIESAAYVKQAGIPAMVDFNRRFDPAYSQLKKLINEGKVGAPQLVQVSSRGPLLPPISYLEVSGGQMRDQGVHFFDLARWLIGEDPVEVFAYGSALAHPDVAKVPDVDTSVVSLKFPSGALAQIDCVRQTGYGYDERIEVMGSAGLAEAKRQQDGAVRLYGQKQVQESGLYEGWFERALPTYEIALEAFVEAYESGEQLPVPLGEGLKAQAIAEAAHRSLQSGKSEQIIYPEI